MTTYTFVNRAGEKVSMEGPEGASEEEVRKQFKRLMASRAQGPTREAAATLPMTKDQELRHEGATRAVGIDDPRRGDDLMTGGDNAGYAGLTLDALTLGHGGEATGTLAAILGQTPEGGFFDYSRPYNERYQVAQGAQDEVARQMRERHPIGATAIDVGGALGTGAGLAKGGLTLMGRGANAAQKMGLAATEGAAYGGAYGHGLSPDDRTAGALYGAGTSAALGGGLSLAGQGVVKALSRRAATKAAPSVDDLTAEAGRLYDQVEASGVRASAEKVTELYNGFAKLLTGKAVMGPTGRIAGADNYAAVRDAMRLLKDYTTTGIGPVALKEIRSNLMEAARSSGKPGFVAAQMVKQFDKMFEPLSAKIVEANALYTRAMKGKLLGEMTELAGSRAGQFSGSGFENALRTEFRALERRIIKGQETRFTPDEVEAIKRLGKNWTFQGALRWLGKFAPTGSVNIAAGGGVPFLVGNAFGGPGAGAAAALTTMGIGGISRAAATRMQRGNVGVLSALTRSGGRLPEGVPPYLLRNPQREALVRALSGYGGGLTGSAMTGRGR